MLKNKKLAALAILGVSSTAILSAQDVCDSNTSTMVAAATSTSVSSNTQPLTADQQAFCDKLNSSAKKNFCGMSAESRVMAMNMVHDCKGKNSCKGHGACKASDHECKGKNSCKGTGSCKVDGNMAVEMACKKMGDKRSSTGN